MGARRRGRRAARAGVPARLVAERRRRRLPARRRAELLRRRYGVAANHVTAIELVTAEAELRRVDAERDPDLFWALRGGGGGFGVVTAIEFELQPIETVFAGIAFYDVHDAPAVLRAWRDWCGRRPTR